MITVSPFSSDRLSLDPVFESHAEPLFGILSDTALYTYTGGQPPNTINEVAQWFKALESRHSPDGRQQWLTWIINITEGHIPIGYLQATIVDDAGDIAWLVGSRWQGKGFASEAATALTSLLVERSVTKITAHVHPQHRASQGVAKAAGLQLTGKVEDGEEIWALSNSPA